MGAGPTGLLLAHELALAGVRATVVERAVERSRMSRAGNLQPRTIEVLELRGLLAPLVARGLVDRERALGHFGALPVPLEYGGWGTRHPYQLRIPQARLEDFLEERVRERGVVLRVGAAVTGVEQDGDGVTARLDGPTGNDRLRGRFLVACDGAHSTVRGLLGVAFPGRPGTMSAVLADVTLAATGTGVRTERRHFSEHVQPFPDGWAVLTPLDGGVFRFIFGGAAQQRLGREAPVTPAEVQRALHAAYGPERELGELRAASRFSDASRQVERYRCGRVLLAGDAAHVHTPMGGQGLNLGLQDAFNLGWKLAAEVQGRAPEGLLDTYHTERHPVGARVLQNTRAQAALNAPAEDAADLRAIFAELLRLPEANRHLSGMISGLDIRYELPGGDAHAEIGRRVPDLDLDLETGGGPARVSDLLHAGRGALLELGETPLLGEVVAPWSGRVDHVAARSPEPVDWDAALVRPDGHLCWAGSGHARAGLLDALGRWFGPAGS